VRRVGFEPVQACRDAVAAAQKRLGRTFGADIAASLAPASVWLDRELIVNALAELLANAVEATATGQSPEIRIVIENTSADGRLEISVIDHGVGMSPTTLQHCFDPFYSDKPAGRQTGLGLSRARAMLQAMGGQIEMRSAPGTGTTARLSIPDWREPVQRAA
jgi:signal transduction histidine kinase